jgi:hypothetical protein
MISLLAAHGPLIKPESGFKKHLNISGNNIFSFKNDTCKNDTRQKKLKFAGYLSFLIKNRLSYYH